MDHRGERQYENPDERTCHHEKSFSEYCFHIFVSLPPGLRRAVCVILEQVHSQSLMAETLNSPWEDYLDAKV
jgi:hypothetical protein